MGWTYIYTKEVPIEAQYLFKKAMEVYSMGKTETALKYLRQTTLLAPRYSKALFEMSNCLAELGQQEEAEERYEQAIRIDPSLQEQRGKQTVTMV